MDIKQFVADLETRNFYLAVEEDKLILRGRKNGNDTAPKATPEIITYIREHKEALKQYVAGEQAGGRDENITAVYRLSALQEGLLFHSLYDTSGSAYTEQFVCRLNGLDPQAFRRSWNLLLERHTILRTGFYVDTFSIPVQCVYRQAEMPVHEADCRHLDTDARAKAVEARKAADREEAFNLRQAPLMRASLLRLEGDDYCMLWTYHHLIIDGWSMQVLMKEFLELYETIATGGAVPEVGEDRYEDYIRYIERHAKPKEEPFWRSYMNGLEEATLLPFITAAVQRNKGQEKYCALDLVLGEEDTRRLQAYAQAQRVTVNTVIQAVWSCLLHYYTGQENVTYGVTVSGRPEDLAGMETRIGLYINMIPIHAAWNPSVPVGDWLRQLQQGQQLARRHQYTSINDIQRWIGIQGDLFDTTLTFQNFPISEVVAAQQWKLAIADLEVNEQTTNYPLSLRALLGAGTAVQFIYKPSMLGVDTVAMIRRHFGHVLEQVMGGTNLLGDIRLMDAEAEQDLIKRWGSGPELLPDAAVSILDLFAACVRQSPDAAAVSAGERTLSYAALDEQSDRLAAHLLGKGLRPGQLVPICLHRSPGFVVAILAVLKAGGAYVPVDPAYPADRIAYMLEDTAAPLLVSDTSCASVLPSGVDAVLLDALEPAAGAALPGIKPGSSDPAYVIYTSGSTGKPKGVLIHHGGLLSSTLARRQYYGATGTALLVPSFSFDSSVAILFGTLCTGGCLLLCSADELKDSLVVGRLLKRAQTILCVPSYYRFLADEDLLSGSALERVILAGEQLDEALVNKHLHALPAAELYNEYGPTENTVWATVARVNGGAPVTIGRPVAGVQLYVVDRNGVLVPPSVPGELCIGGGQVAAGYLHREELTEKKFIRLSFAAGRVYCTGDLVRWRADGELEFLGRTDDQVKIRGFRVEPGEIAAVLQQAPGVQQAVVVAQGEAGAQRLVGYVVADAGWNREDVLAYLASSLPDYMIPLLIRLDAVPLTPNGKVDKKRLPASAVEDARTYVEPRNAREEQLCSIWQSLLGSSRVGIHDNFFELGGHSLLAMRLIALVRKQLGQELSIREVFAHPTVAGLSASLEHSVAATGLSLKKRERPAQLPLSFAQERLWFVGRLQGSLAYQLHWVFRCTGVLDAAALEEAFRGIVQRHEVLRTVIREEGGTGWQVVQDAANWKMTQVTALEAEAAGGSVDGYITARLQEPFDLSQDPMLQVTLVQLSPDEHLLMARVHHIAFDGWSIGILVRELVALYQSRVMDRPHGLAALPVQYADYALWQRAYLQGEVLERHVDYWRTQMEDVPPLELPLDFPRPAHQSMRGAYARKTIGGAVTEALVSVSQREGATLFMTLLAAVKVLLYKYGGQEDVCVGTPVAGRGQQEVEGLIGFFINTLPLRSKLAPERSFRDLLQQVRAVTLGAYEHGELPFEKIVEAAGVERDMSRHPLFQVVFALHNMPASEALDLGAVSLKAETPMKHTALYDLDLDAVQTPEGIYLSLTYCSDLFTAATAALLLDHFEALLAAVVLHADVPIDSLHWLPASEEQKLLGFTAMAAAYPSEATVVSLFTEQVMARPFAPALTFEGHTLSYRELDARTSQLAHYLLERGVVGEQLIPICLERSSELIIAILSVLKAGATYVPIDPSYPAARIQYLMDDCDAGFVLTNSSTSFESDVARIDLDEINLVSYPATQSDNHLASSSLAYLLYTSGSTGQPKGVLVEHGNIVSLVKNAGFIELSEKDVLLSTGSPSFDATTIEYWGTLLNGGRLLMCSQDDLLDSRRLKQTISEEGVSIMWFTAGWFNQLVETDSSIFASLKKVMVGGDRLSPKHVQKLKEEHPQLVLINGYGPTENTTFSLTHLIEGSDGVKDIPIGKPLNNRIAYILDEAQNLCPIGVRGELYVGGAGLGRGYWKQSSLTGEKFVLVEGLGRLYRTGDMARWTADGVVEFFGRRDGQIKIRGYRIEVGEIESALQNIASISEAVVLVTEEEGGKRLVSYVVTDENYDQEEALKSLRHLLPDYMVPTVLIQIDSIPLTDNGKVDRKKLFESFVLPASTKAYTAPRNELEQALVDIWQELLELDRISVYDDFFELGGHSLLAIRLLSAIRSNLGKEVAIRDVFEQPTIAGLALQLAGDTSETELVPTIQRHTGIGPVPLSYGQERLWFIDSLQGSQHYHMPWVFRLEGPLDVPALESSFRAVIDRHQVLSTVIREEGGVGYQVVTDAVNWHIGQVRAEEIAATGEEIGHYLERWIGQPYDLSSSPMLRVLIVEVGEEEFLLATVVHHIAFDGWSIGIMVRELSALYRSYTGGASAQLPALPIQYADYAVWQRSHLSGDRLEQKLAYWKQQLDGVAPLHIPGDARSGRPLLEGAAVELTIDVSLSSRLHALAQREGATLFMVLLAAFKVLLYRYSGQDDICVGTPIAGRQHREVEGLIGFFINTLALRSQLNKDQSFGDLLQQVRQMTLKGYEHQDVPFEKIVEALGVVRDHQRNPVFQVLFTLQNMPDAGDLDFGDVVLFTEPQKRMTAQFDLNLNAMQFDGGLHLNLVYRTSLFEEATVQRMLHHYAQLLESIVDNPAASVSALNLLEKKETLLLRHFGRGEEVEPSEETVVSLFHTQAQHTPSHPALISGTSSFTYQQLNEQTNRLARHLLSLGITAGRTVALCLPSSVYLPQALLAVLKTGAAYLSLDPSAPLARLAHLLEDSAASLTITTSAQAHLLPADVPYVLIDEAEQLLAAYEPTQPTITITPSSLAYVLYTSGSTGKPKGVLVAHRSLTRYLLTARDLYIDRRTENTSGAYAHLAPTFDAALTALLTPLISGKAVVISSSTGAAAFEDPALQANAPYDFIKITPAHLPLLQTLAGAGGVVRLTRRLVIGGEVLKESQLVFLKGEHIEIINEYGPTEATVGCSIYRAYTDEEMTSYTGGLSIGKPMPGVQLLVLDEAKGLCPIGVAGELYIGGGQVARGYLNLPGLTEARFIQNPHGEDRLYRTGDRARWHADGQLEFLGRSDEQVKIRGYRIELGEIETALQQIDTIKEAVVLVHEEAGEKRLVAYVVTDEEYDQELTGQELQKLLPDYMMPTVFIQIDSIPLTTNGKVDRKKLLDTFALPASTKAYTAPRNELEQTLTGIWQELLEVERISIYDDFFQLGGHSLLAIRLIAAIRSQLERELTIREVFDHPTLEGQTILVATAAESVRPVIQSVDRTGRLPLSFAQERLWFIDRLQGSLAYHMPWVFRLKGALDVDVLESSFRTIIQRHEVLRTIIGEEEGVGYQQVTNSYTDWHLNIIHQNEWQGQITVQELVSRTVLEPYQLNSSPMLRVRLIEVGEEEYMLIAAVHHIAFDGWSIGVVVRELTELYQSGIDGRAANLSPLPVQYGDYAVWQREQLSGENLERSLSYWRQQLEHTEPLQLLTDHPRPINPDPRSARVNGAVSQPVYHALQQLAMEEGATLFMTLLAAFKVLLHRHTGQNDICVGTPVAGRQQKELENLIGFFVNTLALRTQVEGKEDFKTLLRSVRNMTLDAYEHQGMPFEKLVDALGVSRDLGRNPLFQVLFVLQNVPSGEGLRLGDLELTGESSGEFNSPFELGLEATEMPEGIHLSFSYRCDLFTPDTIERLLAHYLELLDGIASDTHLSIDHLPLIPLTEQQLLDKWNDTDHPFTTDTLPALFQAQAARTPDAIAIASVEGTLTYAQLDQQSNQLARHLQTLGAGPETIVPICLHRSPQMVVAILAVWKAGAAYLPIDPEYPQERINYMLNDSDAKYMITTSECRASLQDNDLKLICLDEEAETLAALSSQPLTVKPQPHHLAYVIYTSGSTGRPKGVMNEHGGIANRLLWGQQHFDLTAGDAVLQKTTFCFDISIWELMWPLIQGSRLVLARPGGQRDPSYVRSIIEEQNITTVHFVPSMLQLFLEELSPNACPSLKRILCSGEALQPVHLIGLEEKLPHVTLYNLYGPTEAAIEVTCWQKPESLVKQVPIGGPIANTRLYVSAADGELCGIGMPGELLIGGVQVARGYLNLPELTHERFIQNPYGEGRLYRTGDRARWLADGNIECLGRLDEQVKLRGYRIEPGEVEGALVQCTGVEAAVVLLHGAGTETAQLVAYVVGEVDNTTLLKEAATRLPHYMLPSAIVTVEAIPLTTNGKVDKAALLRLNLPGSELAIYEAPRTEMEMKLVSLWEALLNTSQVGIHDNFFARGGHSLLAMRLVAAIRKQAGRELPIRFIFQYPTIAALAPVLEQLPVSFLPVFTEQRPEQLPLSFAQQRLWFIDQLQGSIHYHMPWVLRLKGHLDKEALQTAFRTVIGRYEVLRTFIRETGGTGYQHIGKAEDFVLRRSNGSTNESTLSSSVAELINQPFDLSRDLMLRATLIDLQEDEHLLVVVVHHIAFDGWSTGILARELSAAYSGYAHAQSVSFPILPVQYADYALWQRSYLSGDVLARKLAYWKDKLEGVPALSLLTDKPRPALQSTRGDLVHAMAGRELLRPLEALSQAEGSTLFMTLLAAFKVLLYRHTGQSDICVGTPVAGRQQQEVEGLIGFFVNTLALRSTIQGNVPFLEALHTVRQTTLDAYEHQELPFEKIVEALDIVRDQSRNPVFEVLFTAQHISDGQGLELEGLEIEAEGQSTISAKFDLSLNVAILPDGLQFSVTYCTDLFFPDTIERLLTHYVELLTAIASGSWQSIDQLPLIPLTEQKLLDKWNDTDQPFTNDTLPALFQAQAARTPDAIAIASEEGTLTYAQLDQQSNQLARRLQTLDAGPETIVPISLHRSPQMVVAILAVWKAGAAYLPIDPEYPQERINYMLGDSGASYIVTTSECRALLQDNYLKLICLDEETETLAALSSQPLTVKPQPHHLAYVIYTSGSTGRPKGVMNEHGGIANRLLWGQQHFGLTAGDAVLQKTTFCFDISIWELIWPLIQGSRLVLARPGGQRDPSYVRSIIEEQKITTVHFVPSMLQLFLEESPPNACPSLKRILCSGEALQPAHLVGLEEKLPHVKLYNLYGPTEAAIEVTCWQKPEGKVHQVPIGTPIANTQLYIRSADGAPCGIGIPGELLIGGVQVARGYLHLPELTQERFIQNPYGEGRLYRTGDRARWLADGNIEYLGRLDEQVKLRGYRIEPGEVEGALVQCTGVEAAVVLLHGAGTEAAQLVAYIVGTADSTTLTKEIATRLPHYMIPSAIVPIDTIPLTTNGKADKAALLRLNLPGVTAAAYEAPRTSIEIKLAGLWEDLLQISQVGIHDNFFARGGHSLLMIRLLSRLRENGLHLQLRDLFAYQTVSTQAAALTRATGATLPRLNARKEHLLHLNDHTTGQPLFIMPGSIGVSDSYDELARAFRNPVYGLQMKGLFNGERPLTTIPAIARQHLRWMRRIQPSGPYRLLGHSFGGHVAFEAARQLEAAGEQVEWITILDIPAALTGPDISDDNKLDIVMDNAFEVFEADPALRAAYETWGEALEQELAPLPIKDMVPAMRRFLRRRGGYSTDTAFLLNLLDLRLHNLLIRHQPSGRLKAPLVVARAAEGNHADPALGWSGTAATVHTVELPGHHFSMCRAEGPGVLARFLHDNGIEAHS